LITQEYLVRSNDAYLALLENVIARLKRGDHLIGNINEDTVDQHKSRRKSQQSGVHGKSMPDSLKKDRR